MADAVVINKADGDNKDKANLAVKEFTRALHLYPPKKNGWVPKVSACSAIENSGIAEIWKMIDGYLEDQRKTGFLKELRQEQNKYWLLQTVENRLVTDFYHNEKIKKELEKQVEAVTKGDTSPFSAANKLLSLAKKT